jgi:hypothetical protein
MLSVYDYIYGNAQLAAGFLAIIAGFIALSLIKSAQKQLRAWKYLLAALVLFVIVEVIGALAAFGFTVQPFWTHVLVGFLLMLVIISLVVQIHVSRGWTE